jgi:hypothetical protein
MQTSSQERRLHNAAQWADKYHEEYMEARHVIGSLLGHGNIDLVMQWAADQYIQQNEAYHRGESLEVPHEPEILSLERRASNLRREVGSGALRSHHPMLK